LIHNKEKYFHFSMIPLTSLTSLKIALPVVQPCQANPSRSASRGTTAESKVMRTVKETMDEVRKMDGRSDFWTKRQRWMERSIDW
jgi:hypothetical protein